MEQVKQLISLDQFIISKEKGFSFAKGELSQLLRDIALASKIVNREVNNAGLSNILGETGFFNVQGEEVKKLDVFANELLIKALTDGKETCIMASEENEDVIYGNPDANYVVMFDPLDGSSNIDVNISIGTIFSIYRRVSEKGDAILEDCLQPGRKQVAAGYVLYGSSTMLVYTTGSGVNGFTLEPSVGEYFLSHPNLKMPKSSSIYSTNEGNSHLLTTEILEYLKFVKTYDKGTDRPYKARYVGSMVADFHRTLLKGGIFLYPYDTKNTNGKLRLMYECNPMAFLAEQAGGLATNGKINIMDIVPSKLHQRSALFIGSEEEVELLMSFTNK